MWARHARGGAERALCCVRIFLNFQIYFGHGMRLQTLRRLLSFLFGVTGSLRAFSTLSFGALIFEKKNYDFLHMSVICRRASTDLVKFVLKNGHDFILTRLSCLNVECKIQFKSPCLCCDDTAVYNTTPQPTTTLSPVPSITYFPTLAMLNTSSCKRSPDL